MSTRAHIFTAAWLLMALALTPLGWATQQHRPGSPQLPGVGLRTLLGRPGGNPSAMTPQQLRTGQATTAWLTRIAMPALTTPKLIPGVGGTAYVLRLFVPATGNEELFTLHVPDSPPGQARPLLVGFHGFGVSHLDFSYYNTDFLAEAVARDWFVLAPIQINPCLNTGDLSFGAAKSQLNVEGVMQYVLDEWPIDLDRIYGVGFSMGGGNAISYAARHRDRESGAFAAVVNHTGAVSASDVWLQEPAIRAPLEITFNGAPPNFEYQRAAAVDLSLTDGSLLPSGRHMAVNLAGVAVRTHYYINDPKVYLRDQSDRLTEFMAADPSLSHERIIGFTPPPCVQNGFSGHCWDLLDESQVCDWLALQSLGPPPSQGKVLADRSGRWNGFGVTLEADNEFAAFDYIVQASAHTIPTVVIYGRENLQRIEFDANEFQLGFSAGLQFQTYALDGAPLEIAVSGLTAPPSDVRRNNLLVSDACTGITSSSGWCFDAAEGILHLFEPSGALTRWSITP